MDCVESVLFLRVKTTKTKWSLAIWSNDLNHIGSIFNDLSFSFMTIGQPIFERRQNGTKRTLFIVIFQRLVVTMTLARWQYILTRDLRIAELKEKNKCNFATLRFQVLIFRTIRFCSCVDFVFFFFFFLFLHVIRLRRFTNVCSLIFKRHRKRADDFTALKRQND